MVFVVVVVVLSGGGGVVVVVVVVVAVLKRSRGCRRRLRVQFVPHHSSPEHLFFPFSFLHLSSSLAACFALSHSS